MHTSDLVLRDVEGSPNTTLKYIPILRLKTRHYVFQNPKKRSFHHSLSPCLSAVQTLDDVILGRNATGYGRFSTMDELEEWLLPF